LLTGGKVLVAGGENGTNALSSTEVYASEAPVWTTTMSLNSERAFHTASLLPNGKILVAGGYGSLGSTDTTEIYDPGTLTWALTGSLTNLRYFHTATLLNDGQIFVVGGLGTNSVATDRVDRYDPLSGLWKIASPLNLRRYWHTTTLLPNGNVLVAGGRTLSAVLTSTVELYDAATRTWRFTGSLAQPRASHVATLLPNGKVLVASGVGTNSYLPAAELYDPATGRWTATGSMKAGRTTQTATLLPNGNVLVAGGHSTTGITNGAEIFNPATGTWRLTGALITPRTGHTATLLSSAEVLVVGGLSPFASPQYLSSAELYDPATERWISAGSMSTGRWAHAAALLPNGKVLISGGNAEAGTFFSSAELFDPGLGFTDSWQPSITSITSPLSLGNSLVVTGAQFRGISSASGGNSQDSSTDHPLVQLRNIESGQTTFLHCTNWSATSFASVPVWNFPPGYALATVFVNGIAGTSSILNISVPIPTPPFISAPRQLGGSFQFSFTNSVGALFGALTTTNLALPTTNWTPLGGVVEISPGAFQFTDPQTTNSSGRFYSLRSL
jgi:N-acetylneuraminic acid mutarotase